MEGKVVLITGASSGMGKASALYLAEKGVKAITLFSRGKDRLQETEKEINEKFPSVKTLVVAGDSSTYDDNQRAVDETVEAFGGLHGAFLNAGVYVGGKPLEAVSEEDIQGILNM
jgi:NAD(P)-dependent dehydrogenase (short-subunit alcohol dehydrogenase family)